MLSSSSFSTVVKLKATPFSLFCNAIITQTKPRELGCREIKKKKKKKQTNRNIRVNGKCVFSCMCFFNGVCREIEGV